MPIILGSQKETNGILLPKFFASNCSMGNNSVEIFLAILFLMESMIYTTPTEATILGGGCFWCLEAVYHRLPGVLSTTSGFAGGTTPHPNYKQVCMGTTGHAEVVRIEYDPSKIRLEQILKLFWQAHDPTTYHRQGADEGPQYRSIILYQDENQHQIAEKSKKEAQTFFRIPIVTEIISLKTFYPAEETHQQYYEKNPNQLYTQTIIQPKLQKLKKEGLLPF